MQPFFAPNRQAYHLPDPQAFAIEQERQRHNQALYAYGEYAMFVLLWHITDHEAGLVERCPTCFTSRGVIAQVYGQSGQANCPDCLGTTFEGGYKAKVVRPSLWDANEEDNRASARGQTITQTTSVQATSDFRLRTGDYIFRADGLRYQMRTLSANHLRTGFDMADHDTTIGFNYGTVNREDESSVAYLVAPTAAVLTERLDVVHAHYPLDFTDLEEIRGPLL